MAEIISNLTSKTLSTHQDYQHLLGEIKSKLSSAQLRAAISINLELIKFYWEIGELIMNLQEKTKWGDKLYEVLSEDLNKAYPNTKGFSKTNLKYMRMFASHYRNNEIGQALPDQLSWTHHIVLLQSVESSNLLKKQWYAGQVIQNGWSYRQLQQAIRSNLYERQADDSLKTTNFFDRLPSPQSSLAQELIKDPYKFHFLTIGNEAQEKDIHQGLITHIRNFLMELGQGFALYGSYYPIWVSNKRFEIDLLMYNTKLHSYVVIEIKKGEFKPEYAGQLNFYLSAVDEQLKMPEDAPTIGLLLCEEKDRVIAEYSLKRLDSPISISKYELSKSLPGKLNNILPSIEELEAELSKDLKQDKE